MAPGSDNPRRYSDEEVRGLLKRASDLESQETALPAPLQGPTLEELESIAAEAGISKVALRQAAREMELDSRGDMVPASGVGARILGAPVSLELERTIPGEVSTPVLEGLIPTIQRAGDGMGQPSLLGRTLTWQSTNPQSARSLHVSVRVMQDKTHLLVEERYGNLAGGLFGGIMGGVGGGVGIGVGFGVGLGALGSALFATIFPVSVITGSFFLARTIFGNFVRKRARTLERLMDEMVAVVEEGVAEEEEKD